VEGRADDPNAGFKCGGGTLQGETEWKKKKRNLQPAKIPIPNRKTGAGGKTKRGVEGRKRQKEPGKINNKEKKRGMIQKLP